jgi:Xaa-Pro dipeptidase
VSRETRQQQLSDLMHRLSIGAILLRHPANFAWYTGGADNRIDWSSPLGVAAVLVTHDAEYVLTDNIEAPRVRREEIQDLEVIEHPWHEDPMATIRELTSGVSLGADFPVEGAEQISGEVAPLRYVLDSEAIERYRRVGEKTAAAFGEAASSLEPGMEEYEAAANLMYACQQRGLSTPVILVAADDRITNYRHPIPSEAVLNRRVMLVACAVRYGLCVSLTRFVNFEEPDGETRRRQEACDTILRRMREEATRPDRSLAEAFADCQRFYSEVGHPNQWKLHHQGGMAGYATREIIATSKTSQEIEVGQAFAWNPSITGAKAEETFILAESGPEVITHSRGS